MKDLARKTGRTNAAAWLGFAEGEVLYMGSTGDGDVPLTCGARVKPIPIVHKFAASENIENLLIGDMTVPSTPRVSTVRSSQVRRGLGRDRSGRAWAGAAGIQPQR